jgi:hypothetical protein
VVANDDVGRTAKFYIWSTTNQSLVNASTLLAIKVSGVVPSRPETLDGWDRTERVLFRALWAVRVAVLALLATVGLAMGRRADAIGQAAAFGLACWATLLVSPLSWGHYFMIELPAILCAPLWLWRRGRPWTAGIVAIVPALLSFGHYLAIRQTGPIGLLGLGTTLWFLAVCGLVARDVVRPARPHAGVDLGDRARAHPAHAGRGGHLVEGRVMDGQRKDTARLG